MGKLYKESEEQCLQRMNARADACYRNHCEDDYGRCSYCIHFVETDIKMVVTVVN